MVEPVHTDVAIESFGLKMSIYRRHTFNVSLTLDDSGLDHSKVEEGL